jgi:dTDP-4-amino-4,6-dideoxygalactose transaminase
MILVTKPFLPPLDQYQSYVQGIFNRQWLTNMGSLANELEKRLKQHLGVENLLFVSNGTVALPMAIKALDLKGEIITTPFSFVATTSSIVWENCQPVFVDIDAQTFNIDPTKIEAAITDKNSAILATHVYGNPCDVEAIEQIARKHNLCCGHSVWDLWIIIWVDGNNLFGFFYQHSLFWKRNRLQRLEPD